MYPQQSLDMTKEEIQDTLHNLGFKLSDRGAYWQTSAIWRGGDNTTAIQIYKDTGVWKDFVEGTRHKPFQALVSKVLRTNDSKTLEKYIINENKTIDVFENVDRKDTIQVEKTYSKELLKGLLPHHKFYLDKGISHETLSLYQCGLATAGKLNNRYVFPVFRFRDPETIIGFTGRSMLWGKDNQDIAKWKHIGTKRNWVYPACLGQDFEKSIEESQCIYIVESIGDSLALTENNLKNHIVTFGLDLSSQQLMAILSLNPKKIVIAMNNDQSKVGLSASIKHYISLLDFFDIDKLYIVLPQQNDLSDMHKNKCFDDWANKQVNQKSQQEFILNYLRHPSNRQGFPKKANINAKIEMLASHLNEDTF